LTSLKSCSIFDQQYVIERIAMNKEPKRPAEDLQNTVELDVEAIFRACQEAASQEAAQTERPTEDQAHGPPKIHEVFGSGRQYYRDDNGEEVVVRLDKWS
jgi:hypothetical protein